MKKLTMLFLFVTMTCFAYNAASQTYNSAIGARGGYGLTASYKKFISDASAVEFIAGTYGYSSSLYLSALYQIHKPIDGVDNLFYYYGGGVGAALFSGGSSISLLLNIGLDYSFDEFPVNVSIDYIPGFWLTGSNYYSNSFVGRGGGLAVRYILNN